MPSKLVPAGLILGAALSAAAVEYRIEPAEGARLALEVHKTGLMRGKKHLFVFHRYRGELHYDPERPEASHVRLVIEAASAECLDDWVKPKQLKDIQEYALNEAMRVRRFPQLIFESERIVALGDGKYRVTGPLRVRGVARPVAVEVEMRPEGDKLRFTGKAVVDMKAYGIKPPKAALGMIGTKKEMDFSFELIAVPETGGS